MPETPDLPKTIAGLLVKISNMESKILQLERLINKHDIGPSFSFYTPPAAGSDLLVTVSNGKIINVVDA